MTLISVGVLGLGQITRDVHIPVLKGLKNVTIRWVCDQNADRARLVARAYGIGIATDSLEEAPDVDILLLAIPLGARGEAIATALRRRWHILCEKPIACSAAEHIDLLEKARSANVRLGVGLMRRFYHGTDVGRGLVHASALGRTLRVDACEGARIRGAGRSGWYLSDRKLSGGGILIETGSHLVDQVFYVLDAIAFRNVTYKETRLGEIEYDVSARCDVTTRAGHELPVHFRLSFLEDLPNAITLGCETACLRIASSRANDAVGLLGPNGERWEISHLDYEARDRASSVIQAFAREWMDFIAFCGGAPGSRISAEETLLVTQFIDECYRHA